MDEFARQWTYRSPLKTVTYPKGHKEALPAEVRKAAKDAGALFVPEPEPAAEPEAPKRTKKAE